jgi:hypothetical protein
MTRTPHHIGAWIYPVRIVFTDGEEQTFNFATPGAAQENRDKFRKRRDIVDVQLLDKIPSN